MTHKDQPTTATVATYSTHTFKLNIDEIRLLTCLYHLHLRTTPTKSLVKEAATPSKSGDRSARRSIGSALATANASFAVRKTGVALGLGSPLLRTDGVGAADDPTLFPTILRA